MSLVGLIAKKAKEKVKESEGIKRIGDKRFLKYLEDNGLGIKDGFVVSLTKEETEEEDFLADLPKPVQVTTTEETRTPYPVEVQIASNLIRSDLPLPGDMYYYASRGGIVQGEVIRSYCLAEMRDKDGRWMTVPFQDLSLDKKGAKAKDKLDLTQYFENNDKLRAERNSLIKEILSLKEELLSLGEGGGDGKDKD